MGLPFLLSYDCYEVLSYNGTKSTSLKIPLSDQLNGLELLRTHLLPPLQSPWHLFSSGFLSLGSPAVQLQYGSDSPQHSHLLIGGYFVAWTVPSYAAAW